MGKSVKSFVKKLIFATFTDKHLIESLKVLATNITIIVIVVVVNVIRCAQNFIFVNSFRDQKVYKFFGHEK